MEILSALAPAFAAGFAIQRFIEIMDSFLDSAGKYKKAILGVVSVAIASIFVYKLDGDVLILHTLKPALNSWVDYPVTVLVISAGTEGFNSIMKFLAYKKEE